MKSRIPLSLNPENLDPTGRKRGGERVLRWSRLRYITPGRGEYKMWSILRTEPGPLIYSISCTLTLLSH